MKKVSSLTIMALLTSTSLIATETRSGHGIGFSKSDACTAAKQHLAQGVKKVYKYYSCECEHNPNAAGATWECSVDGKVEPFKGW